MLSQASRPSAPRVMRCVRPLPTDESVTDRMTLRNREPRSRAGGRLWLLAKYLLAGGTILVLVLALVGAAYQYAATERDWRRFPPPGKMVMVEGRRLHSLVQGQGGPAVVFDAPVGSSSFGWALVQPEVAKLTRTLAYDRAGYGWSDRGPRPRSSGQMVAELHELLRRSQVPPPYVLVGASLGGINIRLFALRYPAEVVGIVLVDPAHEDQFTQSPSAKPQTMALRIFQLASRLGIMRLAGMPVDIAGMNVLPPDPQRTATAIGYRTSAVDAIFAETAAIDQSFAEVRRARVSAGKAPLGHLPLIVLTHEGETPLVGEEAAQYAIWVALHRSLATESSQGRQVVVPKSGHFIAVDQPDRVIDAIREVLERARKASPGLKDARSAQSSGGNGGSITGPNPALKRTRPARR
jgi:pimeloyl-ACP methyl ester carboxylesterase